MESKKELGASLSCNQYSTQSKENKGQKKIDKPLSKFVDFCVSLTKKMHTERPAAQWFDGTIVRLI